MIRARDGAEWLVRPTGMIGTVRRFPLTNMRHYNVRSKQAGEEFAGREKGNYVIAGSLLAFVGGIYYTAINKMKQQDDLADALEDDLGINKKS